MITLVLYYTDRLSSEAHSGWLLALNSIAKLGMSTTLCVIWMWSAEIYPTSIRNSMMGLSDAVNRTGVLAAYWIADIVSGSMGMIPFCDILMTRFLTS